MAPGRRHRRLGEADALQLFRSTDLNALGVMASAVRERKNGNVATFILINVLLAVFNLLPVPPLDGFGVVFGLAPRALKLVLLPLHRYGTLILLAVVFLPPLQVYLYSFIGAGRRLILPPLEVVCQCPLTALPF